MYKTVRINFVKADELLLVRCKRNAISKWKRGTDTGSRVFLCTFQPFLHTIKPIFICTHTTQSLSEYSHTFIYMHKCWFFVLVRSFMPFVWSDEKYFIEVGKRPRARIKNERFHYLRLYSSTDGATLVHRIADTKLSHVCVFSIGFSFSALFFGSLFFCMLLLTLRLLKHTQASSSMWLVFLLFGNGM